MVVTSTCLNNMYHHRYQGRTPNKALLTWLVDVSTTDSYDCNMSRISLSERAMDGLISHECNAFKPHCVNPLVIRVAFRRLQLGVGGLRTLP